MALASLDLHATAHGANRYGWPTGKGHYFDTPQEVCAWSFRLYPADSEAATMALGADGYCREEGGRGARYVVPVRESADVAAARQARHAARRRLERTVMCNREAALAEVAVSHR